MRPRAICVCRDATVCEVVGAALSAAGVDVEHQTDLPTDAGDVALIVVDRASRQQAGDSLRRASAPVVVVGDDIDDDGLITLMIDAPVSHLVRDPDDRDLGITSEKLVSGEVFGLEKYVTAGTSIGERVVTTDVEKRSAMLEVTAWAESIGARRPIVHRLAAVVDELLMNALHDAPRASLASSGAGSAGSAGEPQLERRATLRWAHDEQTLAVSVADAFGAIRQRDVIDHLRRARVDRGKPNSATEESHGAGLGLYLVVANVASLIVNVQPGRQTEVVCLFDLARRSQRAVASGVRSLHVFQHQTR